MFGRFGQRRFSVHLAINVILEAAQASCLPLEFELLLPLPQGEGGLFRTFENVQTPEAGWKPTLQKSHLDRKMISAGSEVEQREGSRKKAVQREPD
jgi:hypothetical protein